MLALLGEARRGRQKVLFLTDGVKPRRVPERTQPAVDAHVMPYQDVGTYHMLWSDVVVIEASALTPTSAEAK